MTAVLTAHPLQRAGAFALAALARTPVPADLTAERFQQAVEKIVGDATRAALARTTDASFWLKCSLSFFPNSPMNHPSNGQKDRAVLEEAVRSWFPDAGSLPDVACVLCGRDAVRFFGKLDVPLAESDIYRNTTPRGHAGTALCRPCLMSFRALPYACAHSGGPATLVHSWDDGFLGSAVHRRVRRNLREVVLASAAPTRSEVREVIALQTLRGYEETLTAGVELMVFSNNNRGQTLDVHALDQPLAEWLRRTARDPGRRRGFGALIGAHTTPNQLGIVGLARNAFRNPERIPGAVARLFAERAGRGALPDYTADLAAICRSFATEVMDMNPKDLAEIRDTAARIAFLLDDESAGKLRGFYSTLKEPGRMKSWLLSNAVTWTLRRPDGGPTSLLTSRGMELLFDPDPETRAWFNRQMLLVCVLEHLHARGYSPDDADEAVEDLTEEHGEEGLRLLDDEGDAA
ncbi:hypothetical protein [Actinomadura atramentaria]|uniref:hypothetical protein n=1 Tax=Actinomadura atramentaria TaxID=1990 RepID=UPI0003A168FF|nr:hypothetical protein [Actinomadura atramentaria]